MHRMLASSAAGSSSSPAGKQEVAWCLRPPLAHQSGLPLPLPCPYLMSAHHNRYLLSQDHHHQVITNISLNLHIISSSIDRNRISHLPHQTAYTHIRTPSVPSLLKLFDCSESESCILFFYGGIGVLSFLD